MSKQITLFQTEEANELEIVEVAFVGERFTNAEELFSGFDHMYAITFSYGLPFIDKISDYFKTVEIILGCEAMVKFNMQTIMAFQEQALEEIKRHKSLQLKVNEGRLEFWVAKAILSHEKVFILVSDSGHTRIISGSANFTSRSFGGEQKENINVFENDEKAYNYYMSNFDTLKEFSTNKIIKDALYINSNDKQKVVENLPILEEVHVKDAGIILDNTSGEKERFDFIFDIKNLSDKYASLIPKLDNSGSHTLVTPKNRVELLKKHKKTIEEEQIKRQNYPQFVVDYDDESFSFNNKKYNLNVEPEAVRSDLCYLKEYFDGFDSFIGETQQMKTAYFKFMNYMFLSPFIAKLRYEAYKTDFSTTLFPLYAVLNGPKSAGKSAFMDTVQSLMFGQTLGGISQSLFTKVGTYGALREATGVPLHIEDIVRDRFNKYCGEIVKYDSDLTKEKLINHPVLVMTANDIETIKQEYAKRVYYSSVDAQLTNVTAAAKHKPMAELRKKLTSSFYREYLKRMLPRVLDMVEQMRNFKINSENESWQPDIFKLSSSTIIEIYHELEVDVPDFIEEVDYSNYFGYNIISEKIRNKISLEWEHNRKAFKVFRKQNRLEYTAGEKTYEAIRVCDSLPEILRAKYAGTKVVMKLDEAEKFFGIHFKNNLFNR